MRRRGAIVAFVVGSMMMAPPVFAQQQGITGALGSGTTGTTTPGLTGGPGTTTSPGASPTPGIDTSGTGSFGSQTGPTLGTLGGFRSTTPGGSLTPPTPSTTTAPSLPPSTLTTNPATGVTGTGR
jgi:hypothetical protein